MILEILFTLITSAIAGVLVFHAFVVLHQNRFAQKIRSTLTGETPPQEYFSFPLGSYFPPIANFELATSQRIERYGKWGLFVTSVLGLTSCFLFDPKLVASLFNKTEEHFVRGRVVLRGFFGMYVGPSIIGASGEDWKRQHRILQKALITGNVSNFLPDMVNVVLSKLPKLEHAVQTQEPLHLDTFFREITSDIVVTTAFASNTTVTAHLRELLGRLLAQTQWPLWGIPFYRFLTFIPSVKQAYEDLKSLENISRTILNERRVERNSNPNESVSPSISSSSSASNSTSGSLSLSLMNNKTKYLVDLLNSAQDDESKTFLTDEEIIHNVFTFFLAGTNTTGGLLTWFCHHIVCHPKVYEKVQKEIDEVIPADVSKLSLQDVCRLNYFNMVINETLRLTPPLWRGPPRRLVCDTQVGEWKCEKDSTFFLHIYQIHHSPDLYSNPEKFEPERWASTKISGTTTTTTTTNDDFDCELSSEQREKKIIDTYRFVPFGAGRRVCIGKYFSMLEVRIVLSIVLRLYKLKIPEKDIKTFPKALHTTLSIIEPLGGVHLLIERRNIE